ncbi:hypothetical protein AB0C96_24380 [Streptomyces sp. NPDC048506]|uniref:hypothetical protein n=1 Tax=Streptomyces sp. NPDC048506 TaxID=3155028 RepID=UPI00341FBA90
MHNDQAPAAPPPPNGARRSVGALIGRIVLGLLLLAGAGFTAVIAPLFTMASDNCFDGDTRLICTTGGQQTVGYLPVVASLTAAALTVTGLASRRPAGVVCLVAAPFLLALAWVVSLTIAGS